MTEEELVTIMAALGITTEEKYDRLLKQLETVTGREEKVQVMRVLHALSDLANEKVVRKNEKNINKGAFESNAKICGATGR